MPTLKEQEQISDEKKVFSDFAQSNERLNSTRLQFISFTINEAFLFNFSPENIAEEQARVSRLVEELGKESFDYPDLQLQLLLRYGLAVVKTMANSENNIISLSLYSQRGKGYLFYGTAHFQIAS